MTGASKRIETLEDVSSRRARKAGASLRTGHAMQRASGAVTGLDWHDS